MVDLGIDSNPELLVELGVKAIAFHVFCSERVGVVGQGYVGVEFTPFFSITEKVG